MYSYLFFVSVFRKTALAKGFNYGNKFRRDIAVKLQIQLPITADNSPDFSYMENFIKTIYKNSNSKIMNILCVI